MVDKQEDSFHRYTLLTVRWEIPSSAHAGEHRIRLGGAWLKESKVEDGSELIRVPYSGTSRTFTVMSPVQ